MCFQHTPSAVVNTLAKNTQSIYVVAGGKKKGERGRQRQRI
jgi:hypothetical protein